MTQLAMPLADWLKQFTLPEKERILGAIVREIQLVKGSEGPILIEHEGTKLGYIARVPQSDQLLVSEDGTNSLPENQVRLETPFVDPSRWVGVRIEDLVHETSAEELAAILEAAGDPKEDRVLLEFELPFTEEMPFGVDR